jgi:hypothetical protein
MAKPLLTTTISAPGFLGINTQESSVDLSSGYALEAFNCVIDKFGRIGARKGWTKQNSATNTDLGTNDIEFVFELPETGTVILGGNSKLFTYASGTITTAVNGTVSNAAGSGTTAYTITTNDWSASSIVYGEGPDITPHAYIAQAGHLPLVYHQLGASHAHTGSYGFNLLSDAGSVPTTYSGSPTNFKPNVVLGAYGRTWWADISGDEQTVYFSALLDGSDLSTGDSGYLSLVDVFPNGDEVVGLAAHNGFLIIFGKRNIAIYANPIDVTSLTLADLITNVGCIARDSIVNTGTDVMFLSDTGVRSIARVIQEKSAPINDISFNVRDDLVAFVGSETKIKVKATYYPKDAFYLLTLPTTKYVYCFDLRGRLQNGAARVTIWDSIEPTALHVTYTGDLLLGKEGYLGKYGSYLDSAATYKMRYYTNHFDLGSPTSLKFLKKANFTVVGGVGQNVFIKYGFDYVASYKDIRKSLVAGSVYEFNIAKFGVNNVTVVGSQSFSDSTPTTNTITDTDGTHYQVAFKSVRDADNGYDLPHEVKLSGGYYYVPDTNAGEVSNATVYLKSADALSEYSSGLALEEVRSNLGGSGSIIQLGFEADINQNPLSIQKIDVYVKAGKTI